MGSKAFKWQCLSALSIGAVSDLIIASFICRALSQGKEEFVAVTDLVDRMIAYMFGMPVVEASHALRLTYRQAQGCSRASLRSRHSLRFVLIPRPNPSDQPSVCCLANEL